MRPDLVTFDCYGTLVDWDRGIAGAFRAEASKDGFTLDTADMLARDGSPHEPGPEPSFEARGLNAAADWLEARCDG